MSLFLLALNSDLNCSTLSLVNGNKTDGQKSPPGIYTQKYSCKDALRAATHALTGSCSKNIIS